MTNPITDLNSGDLLRVKYCGEIRFGEFEEWGRDGRARIRFKGETALAPVTPADILENRTADERAYREGKR